MKFCALIRLQWWTLSLLAILASPFGIAETLRLHDSAYVFDVRSIQPITIEESHSYYHLYGFRIFSFDNLPEFFRYDYTLTADDLDYKDDGGVWMLKEAYSSESVMDKLIDILNRASAHARAMGYHLVTIVPNQPADPQIYFVTPYILKH